MRRVAITILIASLLFSVCACAKMISSDVEKVEGYIIDTDYHRAYTQPIMTGKSVTIFHYPAKYYTKIGYDGLSLTVDDQKIYNQCHGHNGEKFDCLLVTHRYDDETTKRFLQLIEENP